jgi:hypothetical protein
MSPLTDAQRRRLAAVATLAVATIAAALLVFASPQRDVAPADRPTTAPSPASRSAAADVHGHRGHAPRSARRVRGDADVRAREARGAGRARWVARRFVAAFSRYELGLVSPAVRGALRAAAAPGFVDELLAQPPRLPVADGRPPRVRLVALELLGSDGRLTEFEAVLRRGAAEPTVVTLVLQAPTGRPYVTAMR